MHAIFLFQTDMNCSCIFKQEEERHWLRCRKAMYVTKNGLSGFVTTQISNLHRQALANLPQNSPCKTASPAHHCDQKLRQPYLTNHLISANNSDQTLWCTSVVEYAKSFIHSSGYKDTKSVEDLDLNGLFGIIQNCSFFQNFFICHLSDKKGEMQQVSSTSQSQIHCYYLCCLILLCIIRQKALVTFKLYLV